MHTQLILYLVPQLSEKQIKKNLSNCIGTGILCQYMYPVSINKNNNNDNGLNNDMSINNE